MRTVRIVGIALFLLLAFGAGTASAQAAPSPYCGAGQRPAFSLGFKTLFDVLGDQMGQPLECEHVSAWTGDALQKTTTGLAFYRKATNTPTFTNGNDHWAWTGQGLLYWTSDRVDPPLDARVVSADDLTGGYTDAIDPRPLVLRLDELPAGFVQVGPQTAYRSNDQLAHGDANALAEYDQYGRETGFVTQFFRATASPSDAAAAVTFVEHTASVYGTVEGAQGIFELRRDSPPRGFTVVEFPEIGDQSFVLLADPHDDDPYQFVQVVVRKDRVIATLLTGVLRGAPLDETIQLAEQIAAKLP